MIEFQKNASARPVAIDATRARLAELLAQTSRTFALSIPLLDQPLRDEVTIAYLLFRIADTIEDEVDWPNEQKANALRLFASLLSSNDARDGSAVVLELIAGADVPHEGYAHLMSDALFVLDAYAALDPAPRAAIARHLTRTAIGMADQLLAGDAPSDVRGAQDYCYAVAGIVGELCTELFIGRNDRLSSVAGELMALAPGFGEGLQLVNILRDEATDADAGRRYIPRTDCRADLMALARNDLLAASEYVRTLESNGASPGTVAFNALNVALAIETLALVAEHGPGAKMPRERVAELFKQIRDRAADREPIAPVLASAKA